MDRRAHYAWLLLTLLTYWRDIAPILDVHCVECHATGSSLNLSRFPFLSKFTSDQPTIVARILDKTSSAAPSMPPGNRPKLTTSEASLITQWRDEGLEP